MSEGPPSPRLSFHGGILGAVVPALVFLGGVTSLALQGWGLLAMIAVAVTSGYLRGPLQEKPAR